MTQNEPFGGMPLENQQGESTEIRGFACKMTKKKRPVEPLAFGLRSDHARNLTIMGHRPPGVLLSSFQQLSAELLLTESSLVNLSESLANPTVRVLAINL